MDHQQPDQSPATIIGIPPAVAIPASAPERAPHRILSADVQRFIGELQASYADRINHRPTAFKRRLLSLLDHGLPPYAKPGGRPKSVPITRAVELFKAQRRAVAEGKQKGVNWSKIALECIHDYRKIRSEVHRRDVLNKLRNSVYARLKRKRTNKQMGRLSDSNNPAVC